MMKDKCSIPSFFLLILFSILHSSTAMASAAPLSPALYVFGDSLVDSGNNNLLPTLAKANFLPYGANYAKGPTGRFTNGRTVADFIAEFLRVQQTPPYLSIHSPDVSASGMNYASGSCGILPETGKYLGKCLSLGEQIDLFRTTIELKIMPRYDKNSIDFWRYMSRSVFIVSIGSNDYINNYLQPVPGTRKFYSPQSFASLLVKQLSRNLQRLYELGARKILVFEIGPIGCIPSMAKAHHYSGQCIEEINKYARLFNNQLDEMIKTLSSDLPGSELILGRAHGLAYDVIQNPSKYGLADTRNPCCVTWENGTSACIPALPPCSNPDNHFFWDGYHLTEAVYKIIGGRCIHDSSICTPKNIKQLVAVSHN